MEKIIKYWPLLFVATNVMEQYYFLKPISAYTFYLLLAVAIFIIVKEMVENDLSLKDVFPFFIQMIVIYTVYQFTFGLFYSNDRSWTYYIAKVTSTLALMISIYLYPDFNLKKLPVIFAYIVTGLTFVGHIFFNWVSSGRQALGFVNPNSMGALAALSFGILFYYVPNLSGRKRKFIVLCILLLLISTLESGSRTAMAILIISLFVKYGFKLKLIVVSALGALVILFVIPQMGINISAVERFKTTVESGNISEGRENEREAAIFMIKENPITGSGLYATQSEESLKISQYGSHNGYLDFIKMLGIPLGGLLIILMLYYSIKYSVKLWNVQNWAAKSYLFIVVSILIATMNEGYLWGVNQPVSTMFFIALGNMAMTSYRVDEDGEYYLDSSILSE